MEHAPFVIFFRYFSPSFLNGVSSVDREIRRSFVLDQSLRQILRTVPKELLKIARQFTAGSRTRVGQVPKGRPKIGSIQEFTRTRRKPYSATYFNTRDFSERLR